MYGRKHWCDQNIAERLTFSSYTSNAREQFGVGVIKRPYRVVALEGYEIPPGLDRDGKDALWLNKAPEKPKTVWDGYCPVALHEVIYECFGFSPSDVAGKMAVVDNETGKVIKDARPEGALKHRPVKPSGLSRSGYSNHVAELYAWAAMVKGPTLALYGDLFTSNLEGETNNPQTVDSKKFWNYFARRSDFDYASRKTPLLSRGAEGFVDGLGEEVERDLGHSVRSVIAQNAVEVSDLETGEAPASFYEAFLPSTYDKRTGELIGARADMEARAAESRSSREPREIDDEDDDVVSSSSGPAEDADSFLARIFRKTRRF